MMNGDVLKICLISVWQGPCEEKAKAYTYLQRRPTHWGLNYSPFDRICTAHQEKGAQTERDTVMGSGRRGGLQVLKSEYVNFRG